jgi:hypothetical protein
MAFDLVVSELVFNECAAGDQEAAKRRLDYIADMDSLHVSNDAVTMQKLSWLKVPYRMNLEKMRCISRCALSMA